MALGPLARNPATGHIERMVAETCTVRVYERPIECRSCIQDTGSGICRNKCPAWPGILERKMNDEIPFTLEERTRWVFREEGE